MAEFKQDMPPPGGYRPISFKRVPAKGLFNGYTLFAVHHRELESKGASLAIYPLLLAERDRAYLKQLRRNREEERELMKNVPGWKVGTWYGEPIYKLAKPDTLIEPGTFDYLAHVKYRDFKKRTEMDINT
ncbi:hypothetical protein GWI33_019203 [Rhynchophorus ferrugineus]|uniref:NADH dehydrogenase [ubiquinone] 1 alpha subcomplex subunit 13 n=1 Tax=Rhynchophorus ferrugineus TaxID=354439 RepID=A0A834HWI7_RHYFE|nr:hypothetical protein GWI33_019203 [Rhynchophorus ferrugineus]